MCSDGVWENQPETSRLTMRGVGSLGSRCLIGIWKAVLVWKW
jgi:hypothetical protein